MSAPIPKSVPYLVVGAGVHGLSTGWHLARELNASGGSGQDVLVVDKGGVAAGASGIACGVVRNNYYQPAMTALMVECMDVWESDQEAFHYKDVGYIALAPEAQEPDLVETYERWQEVGFEGQLVQGEREVAGYMRRLFPDWRAEGLTVMQHSPRGGFAHNVGSMHGLAFKAMLEGARIAQGVEVTGFESDNSGAVTTVNTNQGDIEVEQVVIAPGPWAKQFWAMLGLPMKIDVHQPDGGVAADQDMWTYWYLQEGEIAVDPRIMLTEAGELPPVLHVDSATPLHDDAGKLITDEPWGIYFKPDPESIQGGASPIAYGPDFEVDPYPTGSVDQTFPDMWCAALSHCMERFEGKRSTYRDTRSGGVGAFTADSFPVFDYVKPNVYLCADSNHGYKMIAVGREIAKVLRGGHSSLLHPFRFERFASGDLHPVSHSPYPWS